MIITEPFNFIPWFIDMTSFEDFYISCPCCSSWLIGKKAKADSVNQSVLYSDGMIINDLIPANPQQIVLCPACGFLFWMQKDACHNSIPESDKLTAYSWPNWRFFGCNLLDNHGKIALINHYWKAIELLQPLSVQQEIIVRKSLLWAYNDLYRDANTWRFVDVVRGKINFFYWIISRKFNRKGRALFESERRHFEANIHRLIELLERDPNSEPAVIAELYRELGEFEKAMLHLSKIVRRTHYINLLNTHIQLRDKSVFKVAG